MARTVQDALTEIQAKFPPSFVVSSVIHPNKVDVSVESDGTLTDKSGTAHPKGSFPASDHMMRNGSGDVEDEELERVIDSLKGTVRFHDGNNYLDNIL